MHGGRITRLDWVVVGVCLGWILLEDLSWDSGAPAGVRVATGLLTVAPMVFARRAPVLVGLVINCGLIVRCVLDAQPYENAMPLAAAMGLMYFAARSAHDRRAAVVRGAAILGPFMVIDMTVEPLATWSDPASDLVTAGFLLSCWALGWAIRSRWVETLALRSDRAALERTRATALRAATMEERSRIAGELHDIVSAATTRTRATAEAAGLALEDGDADGADRFLADTLRTTHRTVDDLRRLLRVLRSEARPDAGDLPAATTAPAGALGWARRLAPVPVFAGLGVVDAIRDASLQPAGELAVLAALGAIPFAWRHTRPLAAVVAALVLLDLRHLVLPATEIVVFSSWMALTLGMWIAGRRLTGRARLTGFALVLVHLEALMLLEGITYFSDYVFLTLWVALGGAAGWFVRRRVLEVDRTRAERDAALEARSRELEAALTEERRAIAREMHDVVGHALTLLAIHAGAARRYVVRDPAAARSHVEIVRRAAADAEDELTRLLATISGALGGDGERPPGAEELIALARRHGAQVALDVDVATVPESVGLAAFRIVQEALTNARKHAPGSDVHVVAREAGGVLKVEVRNGPASRGRSSGGAALVSGGHGLVGMAERVRLFAGELVSGPDGAGGWRVCAALPMGHVPVTPAPPELVLAG